ncbi:MAG: bifunctional DNA primase/polymerase [Acidobacteriia bacterium]|nr:bifunctional DNA primase/polymerase [Terriglobia bacterium]
MARASDFPVFDIHALFCRNRNKQSSCRQEEDSLGRTALPPKTTKPAKNSLLEAAFAYAERGWPVLPIHTVTDTGSCSCGKKDCKSPGKHPRTQRGLDDATKDPAQIRQWWGQWPTANVAHLTGPTFGTFVVDVDSEAARAELDKQGEVPDTRVVETGRGWHLFFRYPLGAVIRSNNTGKLGRGIDVKGERGYVLAPPSVHVSGRRYSLLADLPLADPPEWLLKRLAAKGSAEPKAKPAPSRADIPEGGRNVKLTSMAGKMQRHGFAPAVIEAALMAENGEHCDPPLPESEVRSIVKSITRYEPEPDAVPQDDDLIIGQDSIGQLVTKADRVLAKMPDEFLFKTPFSRRIVHICNATEPERAVKRDPQASITVAADPLYLRDVLSNSGKVYKLNPKGLPVPADPSRDITETLIARVKTSPKKLTLPTLWMLSNKPILLEDGRIVCDPGYHEESGVFVDAQEGMFNDSDPDEQLTAEECNDLWVHDFDPCFSQYPFPKDEYKSVVKAGAMSVSLRNLLPAVPLYLITSPAQGSGKSMLVEAISTLTTGRRPAVCTYKGVEEFSKHLYVLLANNDHVISVDNVIMTINHSDLASALTTKGPFRSRILGRSEEKVIENNSVLFLNGNNLQVATDMTRRCLLVRIEPDCERPEYRRFNFNPVTLGQQLHPRSAMSILRIARAHARAGFPGIGMLKEPMGGFEEYDQWIRAALVWCGHADPQTTQAEIRANDPERAGNVEVLYALGRPFGQSGFRVCELPNKLTKDELDCVKQITGHRDGDDFREKRVSHYFSHHLLNRWLEGFRLVKTGRTPNGKTEWRLEMKEEVKKSCAQEEAL